MNAPNILQQLNVEMAGLVFHVQQRLVQINDGSKNLGAGTIWHPEGLILTNAHVVAGQQPLVVLSDGETLPAHLIAHDSRYDLAALVVEASDLPAMDLGDSRQLEPGQWVLALGHPWGTIGATTAGVVIGQQTASDGREWLNVSLRLRPGNSGGPLVDMQGRLVGINTMMSGLDAGMAVPVNAARRFLQQYLTV